MNRFFAAFPEKSRVEFAAMCNSYKPGTWAGAYLQINWALIELTAGVYDWSVLDDMVLRCRRLGLQLIVAPFDKGWNYTAPYDQTHAVPADLQGIGEYAVDRTGPTRRIYVSKRWVDAVRARWIAFLGALIARYADAPEFVGLELPETALALAGGESPHDAGEMTALEGHGYPGPAAYATLYADTVQRVRAQLPAKIDLYFALNWVPSRTADGNAWQAEIVERCRGAAPNMTDLAPNYYGSYTTLIEPLLIKAAARGARTSVLLVDTTYIDPDGAGGYTAPWAIYERARDHLNASKIVIRSDGAQAGSGMSFWTDLLPQLLDAA